MKLTIEIEETGLSQKIEAQVAKAIAGMTEKHIQDRLEAILAIKFERVSDSFVQGAIEKAAALAIKTYGESGYGPNAPLHSALAVAAKLLIKESLVKSV